MASPYEPTPHDLDLGAVVESRIDVEREQVDVTTWGDMAAGRGPQYVQGRTRERVHVVLRGAGHPVGGHVRLAGRHCLVERAEVTAPVGGELRTTYELRPAEAEPEGWRVAVLNAGRVPWSSPGSMLRAPVRVQPQRGTVRVRTESPAVPGSVVVGPGGHAVGIATHAAAPGDYVEVVMQGSTEAEVDLGAVDLGETFSGVAETIRRLADYGNMAYEVFPPVPAEPRKPPEPVLRHRGRRLVLDDEGEG